ncbi:MAG: hypothetical protein RSH78_03895 [Bacilli bacterium]|uniref:GP88 family protein n=1 Tax=Clostridium sp. TaxID=1506 RepID=UPI002FC90E5D
MNLLQLLNERTVSTDSIEKRERITVKRERIQKVVSKEEMLVRKNIERVRDFYKQDHKNREIIAKDDKALNNLVLKATWVTVVPYSTTDKKGVVSKGYYIRSKADNYLYMSVTLGNKKLKQHGNKTFLIFNLLQKTTCPYATAACLKFCYADKGTVSWAPAVHGRARNTAVAMLSNFAELLQMVINRAKNEYEDITFRWHESGDIFSKKYFNKMVSVMANNPTIRFGIYTKSLFVLEANIQLPNASIRYSLDDTTPGEIVKKVRDKNYPTFIAIDGEVVNDLNVKPYKICMGDCTHCRKCYITHENLLDIICPIH